MKLFIAIELGDKPEDINDTGRVTYTKEAAWEAVSGCFYAPNTVIYELVPHCKVSKGKTLFTPIKTKDTPNAKR